MKYLYITFLDYLRDLGRRFRDIIGTKLFFIRSDSKKNGNEFSYQLLDNASSTNNFYREGIENSRRRTVTIQGITFEGDIDPSLLID
uniref:AAA_14 domain-containing protein n=1 Tax=Strongyloides papillosus TaxID=174720 RepID=A0A0N5C8R1_STREA